MILAPVQLGDKDKLTHNTLERTLSSSFKKIVTTSGGFDNPHAAMSRQIRNSDEA